MTVNVCLVWGWILKILAQLFLSGRENTPGCLQGALALDCESTSDWWFIRSDAVFLENRNLSDAETKRRAAMRREAFSFPLTWSDPPGSQHLGGLNGGSTTCKMEMNSTVFPVKRHFSPPAVVFKVRRTLCFLWCYCVLHFFIASDDDGTYLCRSLVTVDIKATAWTRWWNTGRKTDNTLAEKLLTSISCSIFSLFILASCVTRLQSSPGERRRRRAAKVSANYLSESKLNWTGSCDYIEMGF